MTDDTEDGATTCRSLGHLHIVLRDWTYVESSPRRVEQQLLQEEHDDTKGSARRNEIRSLLRRYFETVSVWLLPPPVPDTAGPFSGCGCLPACSATCFGVSYPP